MLHKLLNRIDLMLKVTCGAFCGILVAILFYAVIMRYVLHAPPAWSMELGRLFFLWMVILSAAVVTREQNHIQITLFVDMLPPRVRIVWASILKLLMIGFCGVLVRQGLLILPLVSEAATPTLGISMGWLYSSIPVGGALMGVAALETLVRSIVDYRRTAARGEPVTC
jgi:TRAP-type C4-dicarboxylate transport system permease small subunit